jgi:hypothetical protein
MTNRQIRNELEKIYKERKSWNGGKGPFTKLAIKRREFVLVKQRLLYEIGDAKKEKDKAEELYHTLLWEAVNNHLKSIKS